MSATWHFGAALVARCHFARLAIWPSVTCPTCRNRCQFARMSTCLLCLKSCIKHQLLALLWNLSKLVKSCTIRATKLVSIFNLFFKNLKSKIDQKMFNLFQVSLNISELTKSVSKFHYVYVFDSWAQLKKLCSYFVISQSVRSWQAFPAKSNVCG